MPDFLLEQLSYSLSHILPTTLYIPRNILGILYSRDIFIIHAHPREAKNERLKAKNWLPSAIFLVLFGRNLLTVQKAVIHAANTAVLKSYPQRNRRNGGICLEYA